MEKRIEKKVEALKKYNKAARDITAKREEIIANMYRVLYPTLKNTLTDEEILKQATELADKALDIQLIEINRANAEIERLRKEYSDQPLQENETLESPEETQPSHQL